MIALCRPMLLNELLHLRGDKTGKHLRRLHSEAVVRGKPGVLRRCTEPMDIRHRYTIQSDLL